MKSVVAKEVIYVLVYYKRHWVNMPLLYLPKEEMDKSGRLSRYNFIRVDNQELREVKLRSSEKAREKIRALTKEQIDPETLSNQTLKRCVIG